MRRTRLVTISILVFAVLAGLAAAYRVGLRVANARQDVAPLPPLPRLGDALTRNHTDRANIIVISIDTLRADHMGVYGYARNTTPRIDAFAKNARVFENAYSTTPFTTPSMVSMLTGLNPYRHGVRVLWKQVADDVVTIADWLGNANYQTAAIVSNLVLCDEASGLASRFDHYDADVDEPEPNRPSMLERRANRTTDAAIAWLKSGRKSDQPYFLWVHYIDPHGPYRPPAELAGTFKHTGSRPIDIKRVAKYVVDPVVTDMLDYVDRYDEEILYADREVGRLIDALRAIGDLADAAVIITSDHGEFLLERDDFAFCHGYSVDDAVTRVPLIVKHPSIATSQESAPVSLADIAPTVLTLAGLSVPQSLDGQSLTELSARRAPYIEGPDPSGSGGRERAFVFDQRKIVVRHGLSNIPRDHWGFDLAKDPQEKTRLHVAPDDPAVTRLSELIHTDAATAPPTHDHASSHQLVADDLDDETMEKLRGLGYVK